MEPMLEKIFVSDALLRRELTKQERVFALDEKVLQRVTIHPHANLTEERARHIFGGGLFVSRAEVTDALNVLFMKSVPYFRIAEEGGEVGFQANEEQAAQLADGNWCCLFLPDIPFAILLELFRSLDIKLKEQWLRTLGNFVGEMKPADGHDFLQRLCSVGTRNAPGYVFLSREELANVQAQEFGAHFRFERVAFANIWTIILVQLALGRQLVRSCSYSYFKLTPDGGVVFAEKRAGDEKLLDLQMLGFARPIS